MTFVVTNTLPEFERGIPYSLAEQIVISELDCTTTFAAYMLKSLATKGSKINGQIRLCPKKINLRLTLMRHISYSLGKTERVSKLISMLTLLRSSLNACKNS